MPSNQQRREAAKRKLERQLVRRQERAKVRRQQYLIGGIVLAVLVAGGITALVLTRHSSSAAASQSTASDASAADSSAASSSAPTTPCSYPTDGAAPAAKKVTPPSNLSPANTGTVDVPMTVNGSTVTVTLNRKAAPCTVNSFLSLASQGFYNSTDCWRLTASDQLNILQCGDPSGKGNGGPGYTFADENAAVTTFPAGTVAMANAGSGTNGSQFFIVYKNSTLAAGGYSVFGTVSADGLKVIQDIASKGVTGGAQDGAPIQKATISAVTVPDGALAATGTYPSSGASGAAGSETASGDASATAGSAAPSTG